MPRSAPALVAAWAVGMLSVLWSVVPPAWAGGPGTVDRAPVGAGALAVRITSISPAIPSAGDTLTLTGTITNGSAEPVTGVSAVLRVSTTALPSRGEIPEILSGLGQRMGLPVRDVAQQVAADLQPGGTAPFTLRADVDALGLGAAGVYMAGVEAVGDAGAGPVRQDVDRTFLPWWPEGTTAQPLSVTTLWPLATAPVQDAEGTLLNDDPAVQMSPQGRLAVLLEAGQAAPGAVSLVVDPQTVDVAAAMEDGYEVRTDEGPAAGARTREVAGWLDRLRDALAAPGADAVGTLYGLPDLVATRRGALIGTIVRQGRGVDATTSAVLGRSLGDPVALFPDGTANEQTLTSLARDGVGTVVLSDRSVVEATPTYFTPSGNTTLPTPEGDLAALVTDSGLSAALGMPMADEADRTAARQALLAETLATVTELPDSQRLLVAEPDPTWSPSAEAARMVVDVFAGTPWIRPTPVADALAREPSTVARELAPYSAEDRARELSPQRVGQVREQFRSVRQFEAVLSDPDQIPAVMTTAPSRGLSSWFRTEPVAGAALADSVSRQLAEALASVRVVSSRTIAVSGASGSIPVTVENTGPAAVTVGLEMRSDPPQLFEADPVAPFPIEPGQRTSLEVRAQVAAAGPVPVEVQLTTAGGAPFGSPVEITVQSSAYGDAARLLVRGALVVLALAVVVHGIRRARRRRNARPAGPVPAEQPRMSEVERG